MESSELLIFMEEYGYVALYVMLSAGTFFIPLPNEVIIMMGGFASSHGILHPVPAFFTSYLGIMTALTCWFLIGKSFGELALSILVRKERAKRRFERFQHRFSRYGEYTLGITYFFPLLRHLGPVLAGMNKVKFWKFALLAYGSAFIWALAFFWLGNRFGDSAETVNALFNRFGPAFIAAGCALFAGMILLRYVQRKRIKSQQHGG